MGVTSREEARMSSQVCPRCGSANPARQNYCGQCGAPLSGTALVPHAQRALTPITPRLPVLRIPAPLARAVRPAVALSALGFGLRLLQVWLQHRERQSQSGVQRQARVRTPARVPATKPEPALQPEPAPQPSAELPVRRERALIRAPQRPPATAPQRFVVIRHSFQVWVTTIRRDG